MTDDPVLKALETLLGGQTHLQTEKGQVHAGVSQLQAGLSHMQIAQTHMQIEQTRLRVDVLDRFDRMETKLTAIREDITVNMNRADTAHRAADSTRDELRALSELVHAMERCQRSMGARLDRLEK